MERVYISTTYTPSLAILSEIPRPWKEWPAEWWLDCPVDRPAHGMGASKDPSPSALRSSVRPSLLGFSAQRHLPFPPGTDSLVFSTIQGEAGSAFISLDA